MNQSDQTGRHANQSFRFVQLSDLHLSSVGLPNPRYLLNKRILGYLSWLKKRRHRHQRWILDIAADTIKKLYIDHYAITGDLTHIGLAHEFTQAQEWLALLGDSHNVTVIPGNHDLYVNTSWDKSFKHWQAYLLDDHEAINQQALPQDALTRLQHLYPIIKQRGNVAFICLNSAFDAPWFRATGKLYQAQLKRLQDLLSQPALENCCKILLIHHPVTLTHTPKRKSLLDHKALTSLLEKNPVDLILHGHGHHSCSDSITTNNNKTIPILGMSSSSSTSQEQDYKAEFIVFEVSNKTREQNTWAISKQSYTLNMNKQQFVAGDVEMLTI